MKNWQTDVMIIGSGLAGVRAAIEARRAGASVLVVSSAPPGKANNSAISKGYFAVPGVGGMEDGAGRHHSDIINGGACISDPDLVSGMVNNLEGEVEFLAGCGVSIKLHDDGSPAANRLPGHTFPRVLGTGRGSGVDLLAPLVARAAGEGVSMEGGVNLLSLITDGEKVYGSCGHTRRGEPVRIDAAAVILATGGAGGLYQRTNNAPGTVGLGQAMALAAGLPLTDMEFVQFYPTYLHMPGEPRVMVFYEILVAAAGATIRNCHGEDIRDLYGLTGGQALTRDRLSRAIASEIRAGRGVGPGGEAVVVDLSTISNPEKYRRFIPGAASRNAMQVLASPVVHFTMGGVAVKPGGKTEISGLWAIGEVAGGIHGANRIGGNALAECLALGRVAGREAAGYSLRPEKRNSYRQEFDFRFDTDERPGEFSAAEEALRAAMSSRAGILRDAAGLEECLEKINQLKGALSGRKSAAAVRLSMMLDVAQAICLPALERRESRGSHYRLDFPAEGEEYLGNFLVRKVSGGMEIKFVPRSKMTPDN